MNLHLAPAEETSTAPSAALGTPETAHVAKPSGHDPVFFVAKGGADDDVSVNCGVEIARLSKVDVNFVDLTWLGEWRCFSASGRATPSHSLDNLHRLDRIPQDF